MKLSVYIISHPLILQLSNLINNNKTNKQNYNYQNICKTLGFLVIYETIRTWLKFEKLYIHKIEGVKEIILANSEESYLIITNIAKNIDLISTIKDLIPKCKLGLIHLFKTDKIYQISKTFNSLPKDISKNQKIIILDKYIETEGTIKLIEYLVKIKKVDLNQIRISCIACEKRGLKKIAYSYPKIRIYTTEIIVNNERYSNNYLNKLKKNMIS
uniref:Uracil phosphoribosyltransferase or UMP pyrophosphorylase n=1 Tax=Sporolithon durum TaxID=48970 RepID=A0A141SD36_9FLOR|nr:uracil phosphoribosyltransferase or UMP pyrophosphorylase [Sporolithon durum]AMK96204.1 uracil phosphoribosyltransferase or UMP pyrophosphorylase [Sporolithon durum]